MKKAVFYLLAFSVSCFFSASCENSKLDNTGLEYAELSVGFTATTTGPEWSSDQVVGIISTCTRNDVTNTPMSSASESRFMAVSDEAKYTLVHCDKADEIIAKNGDHNFNFKAFSPYVKSADISALNADIAAVQDFQSSLDGGVYTASANVTGVIAPVELDFNFTAVTVNVSVPANIIDESGNTVIRTLEITPSSPEAFTGCLAAPATFNMNDGTLSIDKTKSSQSVQIDFGENGYALPKGRTTVSCLVQPFTVPMDGFDLIITDVNGDTYEKSILTDKVSSSYDGGSVIDLTVTAEPAPTGCVSPVEWLLGYDEEGKARCSTALQPNWTVVGPLAANADTYSHIWTGNQDGAQIEFITEDKNENHILKYEMSNFKQYNYASPCMKGFWTGDCFEFTIPVVKFRAGTEVTLTLPMYGRGAPVFWNVEYLDGTEWKCNKESLNSPDNQFTMDATWVLPHGNKNGTFEGIVMSTSFTMTNAIKNGSLKIRITVADGSIVHKTGTNYTTVCERLETYVPSSSLGNRMVGFVNKTGDCQSIKVEW